MTLAQELNSLMSTLLGLEFEQTAFHIQRQILNLLRYTLPLNMKEKTGINLQLEGMVVQ